MKNGRPRFPTALLTTALAVVADAGGLACLFLSDLPLALKLSIGVPLVLVPIAALFLYLGEMRSWLRQRRRIHQLEQENRRLREAFRRPTVPSSARKVA